MTELTKENFILYAGKAIETIAIMTDPRSRAEHFANIMEKAREFSLEEQARELAKEITDSFNEPELWELPQSFEKEITLQPFPLSCLPTILNSYVKAVCEYVQIVPEMAVLPLLSVLSLCVQGKVTIKHPGNGHVENLNLYTMTIAAPGERKSGCFREFMNPVETYQNDYNLFHENEIKQYEAEREYLERQKSAAMSGKNASMEKVRAIVNEILALEEKHELRLNVSDVTPEALAWEMYLQGGKIGVVDDEGAVFDVLSGLYSGGSTNINIFLKAYDGSSYTIIRRTKDDIVLNSPLLTIGLMVQPAHFDEAMGNRQFSGRGFIHRFLFAFPESRAGSRSFISENIPEKLRDEYNLLVRKLLMLKNKKGKPALLMCDEEAYHIFREYFEYIEQRMKQGGQFEQLKEWANKQFARCLKIAGILHLCEHEPTQQIDGKTALNAVNIAMWSENHALKALSGELTDSEEVRNARYIANKLKQYGKQQLTKHDLLLRCRPLKAEECEEPLEILEDMHIIKRFFIKNGKGKPKEKIEVNPLLF